MKCEPCKREGNRSRAQFRYLPSFGGRDIPICFQHAKTVRGWLGVVAVLCLALAACSATPPEPTDSTAAAYKHRDGGVPDAPIAVPPPVCADCSR